MNKLNSPINVVDDNMIGLKPKVQVLTKIQRNNTQTSSLAQPNLLLSTTDISYNYLKRNYKNKVVFQFVNKICLY